MTPFYTLIMQGIELLMDQDPDIDSPEGKLLKAMALALAEYEKAVWQ